MQRLDSLRRSPRRWVVVPTIAIMFVLVMTGLDINGSSVALNDPSTTPGLLAGDPHPIRSDEWWVRASLVARQAETGFDATTDHGMGSHTIGIVADIPTLEWTRILKPHQVAYGVLDVGRAYTLEWWTMFALIGLGPFALVWMLTRRVTLAALLGVTVAAAPVAQWWTNTITATSIGYLCFALAALIAAARSDDARRAVAWSVLAGWLLACAAVVPYPAWVIGLLLGLLPIALYVCVAETRARTGSWRPAARALVPATVVAAVCTGAYFITNRSAFAAIAGTVYPGARSETGGTGDVLRLLGAPYYWFVARNPGEGLQVLGTNESEASGPLFLLLPALVVLAMLALLMPRRSERATAIAVASGGGLLLAWFLLPIPASVGRFLLLDQVPSNRLLHTFAPLSAVAFGLVVHLTLQREPRERRVMAVAAATVMFTLTAWAGGRFVINGVTLGFVHTTAIAAAVAVGVGLAIAGWARAGTALLAAVVVVTAVQTNPWQRGLEPLTASPVAAAVRAVDDTSPGHRWVVTTDAAPVISALTASGVRAASGTSVYPVDDVWLVVDPTRAAEDVWNRYAHIFVSSLPTDTPTSITLRGGDTVDLGLDLCGADASGLDIMFALMPVEQPVPACGAVIESLTGPVGPLQIVRLDG